MSLAGALRDFLLEPAPEATEGGGPHVDPGAPSLVGPAAGPVAARRTAFLPPVPPAAPATEPKGRPRAARASRERAGRRPSGPGPRRLAVLCRSEDAAVLTVVVGGVLRRLHRAGCALVLVWPNPAARARDDASGHAGGPDDEGAERIPEARRATGARPARRLAASLAARDLPATCAGRVVSVELPSGPGAAAALERARAAAADVPVVLLVAGPRDAAADAALASCAEVLVAGADEPVGALAAAALAARGLAVATLPVPRGLARVLAARGLLLPAAARQAVREAVGTAPRAAAA